MTYRPLVQVLLLTVILLASSTGVASSCAPTRWIYDATELPSCVTLMTSGVHDFEVYNDCPDSLTLSVSGCPTCTVPETIPPEDVGTLGFGGPPDPEGSTIDVDWDTGDTSGSAAFTFPTNRCPQGDGCTVAPGTASGAPWAFALLLALGCLWRSRRARR